MIIPAIQNATNEIELNKTIIPPIIFVIILNTIEKKLLNTFPVLLMPSLVLLAIF